MKITKRILPTVIMLFLGIIALHAQHNKERPPMDAEKIAEKQTARMTENLSLDEKQAEQVNAIHLKYAQQKKVDREKAMAEREAKKAQRQKTHDAKMAELKQILSAEQYTKLEQSAADRKSRKGNRKGGKNKRRNLDPEKRAETRTNRMAEKLDLNEDQTKALQQANLDFAKKRQAIIEGQKEARQANREAMKSLKEEQKTAIADILTQEQMKQWEKLQQDCGNRHRRKREADDGRM